jgi:dihydroceramidase
MTLTVKIFYHVVQDPLFHQVAFAVLTAAVVFRSIYVMEVDLRNSLRTIATNRATIAGREKDLLNQMWWMIGVSLSTFLGGIVIWNLDNEYCSTLRRWRRQLGLPWGILLEGHGWW